MGNKTIVIIGIVIVIRWSLERREIDNRRGGEGRNKEGDIQKAGVERSGRIVMTEKLRKRASLLLDLQLPNDVIITVAEERTFKTESQKNWSCIVVH